MEIERETCGQCLDVAVSVSLGIDPHHIAVKPEWASRDVSFQIFLTSYKTLANKNSAQELTWPVWAASWPPGNRRSSRRRRARPPWSWRATLGPSAPPPATMTTSTPPPMKSPPPPPDVAAGRDLRFSGKSRHCEEIKGAVIREKLPLSSSLTGKVNCLVPWGQTKSHFNLSRGL